MHDRELDRYEIDDYERIYRCNVKYSPTEIEKRWERKKPKEERIMFIHHDEFINEQFYVHIFNNHSFVFGYGVYKADTYTYLKNRHIKSQLKNRNRNRNYCYETDDDDDDDHDDEI